MLEKEKPDAVIITHYHLDHSTWVRYAASNTRAQVFIPEKEEPYLTSLSYVIEHTAGPFGMAEEWKAFVVKTLGYRPLES